MTSNEHELVLKLAPSIKAAARTVSFQWPGVMNADEIEQQLYVKLLESPGTVLKVLAFESKVVDRFITRMGHQIASQERTDYSHYKGAYNYSAHEVKKLLKSGGLKEQSIQAQTFEEKVSAGKEPTTQIPVQVTDLRAALVRVSEKNEPYASAIINRFRLDEYPANKSEENALSRGIEALVNEMNRVRRVGHDERRDGPGTRSPIDSEAARNLSDSQWDSYLPLPAHHRDNSIEKEVWE